MIKNTITKNFTSGVIHIPDIEKNPSYNKIKNIYLNYKQNFENTKELQIITWNNLKKGLFETSCDNHNVPYKVYGKETVNWNNHNKFRYNVLAANETDCQYIMGCDSHDAILTGSPIKILNIFKQKNCKLMFNCEKYFYPDIPETQHWKQFQKKISKSNMSYLNSGVWIGETQYVKEFFQRCHEIFIYNLFDCSKYKNLKKESIGCDQSSVHSVFVTCSDNEATLNYEADVFLNVANLTAKEISFNISVY